MNLPRLSELTVDPAIRAQWNFVCFYSIGVELKNIPPGLSFMDKMRHKCTKS